MTTVKRWLLLGTVLALIIAGCAAVETAESDEAPVDTSAADASTEDVTEAATGLATVCPNPIVIQTDWFPEAEHGALYELIGEGYTVDTDRKVVRGPLVSGGEEMGIDVEVRTGGPAIGFQQPIQQMYVEDDITLGYVGTDEAVFGSEDTPTISVMAPLEKNPQIIMWDPATYPDVESIADLGENRRRGQRLCGRHLYRRLCQRGRALRRPGRSLLRRLARALGGRGRPRLRSRALPPPSRTSTRTSWTSGASPSPLS